MPSLASIALMSAMMVLAPTSARAPQPDALDVMAEFKAICLDWEGDLEATEDLAKERGYHSAQERLDDFTPLGNTNHRTHTFVWAKQVDGVDVQVMARPRGFISFGGRKIYQDVCSVAVAPGHRGRLRSAVARHLGQDSFRQAGASVFAWTPGPEGPLPVRRNVFENRLGSLMSDRGLRMVTVGQHRDRIILSYFVPSREGCRVRLEYTETEPNIVCGFTEP